MDIPLGSLTQAGAVTTQCETLSDLTQCLLQRWESNKKQPRSQCAWSRLDVQASLSAGPLLGLWHTPMRCRRKPCLKSRDHSSERKAAPSNNKVNTELPFSLLKYHCNDLSLFMLFNILKNLFFKWVFYKITLWKFETNIQKVFKSYVMKRHLSITALSLPQKQAQWPVSSSTNQQDFLQWWCPTPALTQEPAATATVNYLTRGQHERGGGSVISLSLST